MECAAHRLKLGIVLDRLVVGEFCKHVKIEDAGRRLEGVVEGAAAPQIAIGNELLGEPLHQIGVGIVRQIERADRIGRIGEVGLRPIELHARNFR